VAALNFKLLGKEAEFSELMQQHEAAQATFTTQTHDRDTTISELR
jgi:hypothetical protein